MKNCRELDKNKSYVATGFVIVEDVVDDAGLSSLKSEIDFAELAPAKGGIRNAEKKYSGILKVAQSKNIVDLLCTYLGNTPRLVRAILFDKNVTNNWLVSWHQDKTIAVSERLELDGWGPWSIKDGIHHVQPPEDVLNSMVTLRVHLDEATAENGCLKVIPGSHMWGVVDHAELISRTKTSTAFLCEAKAGSVLVMKPHIVHASGKARVVSRRRVIHLEYSNYVLPSGLEWG